MMPKMQRPRLGTEAAENQVLSITNRNRPPAPPTTIERLLWNWDEVFAATGIAKRTLQKAVKSGAFPAPDKRVGRKPYWKPSTIRAWIESGGRS